MVQRTTTGRHEEMRTIDWISPDQLGAWDDFVARHPLGLVYHLSSWQTVLETAFGHIRGRFLVLRDDDGRIQAGLPVYNIRSWLLKNRTVCVPFATICDPLVSTNEEFSLLWKAIEDTARTNKSKRIEIRTRRANTDCLPAHLKAGKRYMHHYLPLDRSGDALYRTFHDSCVRRRVSKAIRAGVVVEERRDQESLRAFHAMLSATRRRLSLPPMPFAFFEAMFRCLVPDLAMLYLATHEGQPVGGALVFKFKDQWTAEYSGHADDAPPGTDQLVYWHAIQQAGNNGAAFFSFGRTSLNNTSLLEYKRRWATVEEELTDFEWHHGSAPAQANPTGKSLPGSVYAAVRLLRYTPASVQKSFGDFCYRHLG
jgi:hypothetical protein